MKIICLMENTIGNNLCQAEHGFSVYVETETDKVLIDTGASDLFLDNASVLGVDLSKVEAVFLSHGHYDHSGGILSFANQNSKAPVIIQKKAFGDFWHKSENVERYIGIHPEIIYLKQLHIVEGCYRYGKNIEVFTGDFSDRSKLVFWPKGNLILKEKIEGTYVQDDFLHEQYIVLREKEKLVLVSGCAHNGILNILSCFKEKFKKDPDVVISGFHMMKKDGYTKEDIVLIQETAKQLKQRNIMCYTGHCTGPEPYEMMKEIMGGNLAYLHCGDSIEIEN